MLGFENGFGKSGKVHFVGGDVVGWGVRGINGAGEEPGTTGFSLGEVEFVR
jgi:hypothetical protein